MLDIRLLLSVLLVILPMLYGVAFFNYLLVFLTEERLVRRLARPVLLTAIAADVLYLLAFTFYFEHLPVVTVPQVVGAVGFAVAVVYLWVEGRTGTLNTGPFILALVLICKVVSALFPRLDREVPELLRSIMLNFHVSAAVLGYSAFAVAAVYGLLYLMLYYAIRRKRFGLVFQRLPSLDILDRMNFYAVVAGFVLLSIAIVCGSYWSVRVFGTVWADPKVLVALLTWVIYGMAVVAHQVSSWKGPRLAYSSLIGFLVVVFSIFAVNFYLTSFHHGFAS